MKNDEYCGESFCANYDENFFLYFFEWSKKKKTDECCGESFCANYDENFFLYFFE
ncbi:hypothetical protein HHO41_06335 [Bacillus sp. DNRA2]|uniref:hypothetical protein n=1 Tax=Bacillus sp. DNRA2 TaxID=2723053 RepID=UPI00145C9574|nr:hypothetical protein [Bacillus sp. DNRA2]NMD69900.1 hypothetical protein [Bacillus sp. DNRA2]